MNCIEAKQKGTTPNSTHAVLRGDIARLLTPDSCSSAAAAGATSSKWFPLLALLVLLIWQCWRREVHRVTHIIQNALKSRGVYLPNTFIFLSWVRTSPWLLALSAPSVSASGLDRLFSLLIAACVQTLPDLPLSIISPICQPAGYDKERLRRRPDCTYQACLPKAYSDTWAGSNKFHQTTHNAR